MVFRDLLEGALEWVGANLHYFDPEGDVGRDEVPLAELCILCMCLYRSSDRWRHWVQGVLDFVVPIFNAPAFRERLARTGFPFASRIQMLNALRSCGVAVPKHDLLLFQRLIDEGNVGLQGTPAHRMLELRYALDLGGFRHSLPTYKALYNQTVLASSDLNLIYLTDADAYRITHILFYISDLGRSSIRHISRVLRKRAERIVGGLLGVYIRGHNWDLVAELLIGSYSLRSTGSDWYDLGWECMKNAQLSTGAIPGPRYDDAHKNSLTEPDQSLYLFRQCYHTTLVSGLAHAICMNSNRARPQTQK
jgi:hypothetical protein